MLVPSGNSSTGTGSLQPLGDLLGHRHGAGQARPIQKNRPARPRRLAEKRPATDLHLGHKKARHRRADDEDVEIAEVIRNHQPAGRRLAFHLRSRCPGTSEPRAPLPAATGRAAPASCGPRTRLQPVAKNAECESECQRHSAPDPAQRHSVSGARKRLRAAAESNFRSRSVRKSMVRNSRSQAGGAAMRAPIAR